MEMIILSLCFQAALLALSCTRAGEVGGTEGGEVEEGEG